MIVHVFSLMFIDFHWFPLVLIKFHQFCMCSPLWLSFFIIKCNVFSLILICLYQCVSMFICFHWVSFIIIQVHRCSLTFIGFHWSSFVLIDFHCFLIWFSLVFFDVHSFSCDFHCFQWFSFVFIGFHCFNDFRFQLQLQLQLQLQPQLQLDLQLSIIFNAFNWCSLIHIGADWFSRVFYGFHCVSMFSLFTWYRASFIRFESTAFFA